MTGFKPVRVALAKFTPNPHFHLYALYGAKAVPV